MDEHKNRKVSVNKFKEQIKMRNSSFVVQNKKINSQNL